jgi:hypothetical protein
MIFKNLMQRNKIKNRQMYVILLSIYHYNWNMIVLSVYVPFALLLFNFKL